jgi:hypothetical protein
MNRRECRVSQGGRAMTGSGLAINGRDLLSEARDHQREVNVWERKIGGRSYGAPSLGPG